MCPVRRVTYVSGRSLLSMPAGIDAIFGAGERIVASGPPLA